MRRSVINTDIDTSIYIRLDLYGVTTHEGSEPSAFVSFREWVQANGGFIHPSLRFASVPSGTSVNAIDRIEQDTIVLSCPFSLAITIEKSSSALLTFLNANSREGYAVEKLPSNWTERMLVCSYVVAHWIAQDLKTFDT
ncbi:hypothetical protein FRB94_003046 [Tulasnella sp. JGI-2019a]|nr:hypothetical protein FRB94_003046 [Tulasnella sp. JGI-2019a]